MNCICVREYIIAIALTGCCSLGGAELITGDGATGTTFAVGVGPITSYYADTQNGSQFVLFTGAGTALANNSYAVAQIKRGDSIATPLAPAGSALNGTKITLLSSFGALPLVVKDGVKKIYFYTKDF